MLQPAAQMQAPLVDTLAGAGRKTLEMGMWASLPCVGVYLACTRDKDYSLEICNTDACNPETQKP